MYKKNKELPPKDIQMASLTRLVFFFCVCAIYFIYFFKTVQFFNTVLFIQTLFYYNIILYQITHIMKPTFYQRSLSSKKCFKNKSRLTPNNVKITTFFLILL